MMPPVVLIHSHKGGVGKTFLASCLVSLLRSEHHAKVAAYDADGVVGALVRVYGTRGQDDLLDERQDPLRGCAAYDIRRPREARRLLDSLSETDAVILHDLPGGCATDIARLITDTITDDAIRLGWRMVVDGILESGRSVVLVHVLDLSLPAVRSVEDLMEILGDRVRHVAVRNLQHGDPDDFVFWLKPNGNQSPQQRLAQLGGLEVMLPRLKGAAATLMNEHRIPLHAGGTATPLSLLERSQWRHWWTATQDALHPLLELCLSKAKRSQAAQGAVS